MDDPPALRQSEDEAHAPRWLNAAGWMWLRGRFLGGLPDDFDAEAAFMYLVTLTRAQAAAERAFSRLVEAHADDQSPERTGAMGIDAKPRIGGETHAFLVSAHLFWTTLNEVRKDLHPPELTEAWRAYRWIANETRQARDHIEHLPERIRKGRQRQPAMPRDVFREAVGAFDGTKLTFGHETFDLRQIRDSIRRVEEKVAPRLGERLTPKFSVTVDRPAEAAPD